MPNDMSWLDYFTTLPEHTTGYGPDYRQPQGPGGPYSVNALYTMGQHGTQSGTAAHGQNPGVMNGPMPNDYAGVAGGYGSQSGPYDPQNALLHEIMQTYLRYSRDIPNDSAPEYMFRGKR